MSKKAKELLEQEIAKQKAIDLKEEINKLYGEWKNLNEKICLKEEELQEICPHTHIKQEYEYIEGDYYNKGTYISMEICTLCEKELEREESEGSYG
jgi:hypothetical protein